MTPLNTLMMGACTAFAQDTTVYVTNTTAVAFFGSAPPSLHYPYTREFIYTDRFQVLSCVFEILYGRYGY